MCEDIDYKIGVMQAFKEGKVIECRNKSGSIWNSVPDPAWNWSICDYRVKPEPKEDWVVELYVNGKWNFYQHAYNCAESDLKRAGWGTNSCYRYRRIEPATE